ncbi:MAG: 2Fe-2S iron-sulfur cluster-binding protein [Bernardetiaceae bacterium]
MSNYYSLKVKQVVRETKDAVTIHFKQPLFKKIKYKPGQFLTLMIPVNGQVERRSYSICTAPQLDSTIGVTVKRVEGGKISNLLNDTIKEGEKVEIMEPMGTFTAEPDKDTAKHYVLIGGGSGITPLMSILKSVLAFSPQSVVSLIYANRNEQSIIFKDALEKLKDQHPERLYIRHILDEPFGPPPAPNWETGRLINPRLREIIDQELPQYPAEHTEYYICGPTGLMDMAQEALEILDIDRKHVHRESFYIDQQTDVPLVGIQGQQVTITLDHQAHQITVPADKTILDAALDEGLDMPYSCQSGVCTACRGKLESGRVHMQIDEALSPEEIEQGYVLTCQAHPLDANVTINMD